MPPQSTAASLALWKSDDPAAWRAALDAYHTRMGALNNDKLVNLDRWFHEELPNAIAKREPPHMRASELVKLVDWKMTRGKVRPRLLDFAKAHSDETARDATSAAIAVIGGGGGKKKSSGAGEGSEMAKTIAVEDLPSALEPLVALKGMGPATASAVMAAVDSSIPFMSDDIIAVALPPSGGSSDTYSMPRLLQLCTKAGCPNLASCVFFKLSVCTCTVCVVWSRTRPFLVPLVSAFPLCYKYFSAQAYAVLHRLQGLSRLAFPRFFYLPVSTHLLSVARVHCVEIAPSPKVRAKAKKVGLTAGEVERAVYSEAALTKKPKNTPPTAAGGGGNKKRKR